MNTKIGAVDKQKVQKIINGMTLEQKVGQCFVLGFVGTILTPVTLQRIRKYFPAGIRTSVMLRAKTAAHDPYATSGTFAHRVARPPKGNAKDYLTNLVPAHVTNEEYCEMLNSMKRAALENGAGVPLHITLDAEGGFSSDYCFNGIHLFPQPMGITRTGDKSLAYEVAWAIARQFTALGFNWIHSPVLDVNTEPMNSEISIRSYSSDFDEAGAFALEAFRGFRDGGLITTGKHFPGRGPSVADAHHGLPVTDLPDAEMRRHLRPYEILIKEGLPCVMTAHSSYTAFDDKDIAATLSKKIISGILKEELGFQGAVTTDDITMGGIVERHEVSDAVIESINAGCDLVLMRDDSPLVDEVIPLVIEAVRKGRISEHRLNDALTRSISVKMAYGLFENGNIRDISRCNEGIRDPEVTAIAAKSAAKTTFVLKNEEHAIPVSKGKRILLVEQVNPMSIAINQSHYHPGILWKKMYEHDPEVGCIETLMAFSEDDKKRVLSRLDDADVIVITNYHWRRGDNGNSFVKMLHEMNIGKSIIVVTNNHYPLTVEDAYRNIILSYGIGPESLENVARLIYGAESDRSGISSADAATAKSG